MSKICGNCGEVNEDLIIRCTKCNADFSKSSPSPILLKDLEDAMYPVVRQRFLRDLRAACAVIGIGSVLALIYAAHRVYDTTLEYADTNLAKQVSIHFNDEHVTNTLATVASNEAAALLRNEIKPAVESFKTEVAAQLQSVTSTAASVQKKLDVAEAQISQVNPLNQPISDISLRVSVSLRGRKYVDAPMWGGPSVASAVLLDTNFGMCQLGDFSVLYADASTPYFIEGQADGDKHGYIMEFRRKFFMPRNLSFGVYSVTNALDMIRGVKIDAKIITHNSEVSDGTVELLINGAFLKRFQILPQSAAECHYCLGTNSGNSGFTIIATNSIAPDVVSAPWYSQGSMLFK